MFTARAPSPDRRMHRRFTASELRGLRTARVKYGHEVTIIDLSSSGVLFETPVPVTPDSTIVLEFAGPTQTFLVPSRVVRCQSLGILGNRGRSKGACVFKRPLPLRHLVAGTERAITGEALHGAGPAAAKARLWQPVVGKYRDGRLVRGYTSDFNPSKSSMQISPTPVEGQTQSVALSDLDALFFLPDPRRAARGEADVVATEGASSQGRKVALVLPNGTELIGSTFDYKRNGNGFFVHPIDRDSGAVRVFVTPSGVRNIRFI
jgi:hypothetical protein